MMTNKLHLRKYREEGKSGQPHPEPFEDNRCWDWFDHTAGLDGFLRGSGLIFFFGFSLPGAAGVECSMAREMGNTVIFSISPDLMRDFCFTIKLDFIIFTKNISQEPLLNSTTNSHLQLGKDWKRKTTMNLMFWWDGPAWYFVPVLLTTMMVMLFKLKTTWSGGCWVQHDAPVRRQCHFIYFVLLLMWISVSM